MIISRTPFRVSFAGGGTDLSAYYKKTPGAVVSTAIDKYMYVTVNKYFDDSIILKYSRTELVKAVDEIKHPILRECLKLTGLTRGVEVTSMADVVGGTGLGSSSSFTVGVLHALHAYKGEYVSAEQLAREACDIEIARLKEPIGKQDQYIAAYGGFRFLEFLPDESVRVDPLILPDGAADKLHGRLLLLYTGRTRKAGPVMRRFQKGFDSRAAALGRLRVLADQARAELQAGKVDAFGELLHEAWEAKKEVGGVTNPELDKAYEKARKAGAIGGKILGAGGGGFLLLFAPERKHGGITDALGLRRIPFRFEKEGSKIVYVSH
jgi:D-glycero-alpha-D-manno-heptose-7-phosphate kinase